MYVGGADVASTIGYPIAQGDSLDLPVTPMVLTFAVMSGGAGASDVRTLETG